jgi:hypothetical protein
MVKGWNRRYFVRFYFVRLRLQRERLKSTFKTHGLSLCHQLFQNLLRRY